MDPPDHPPLSPRRPARCAWPATTRRWRALATLAAAVVLLHAWLLQPRERDLGADTAAPALVRIDLQPARAAPGAVVPTAAPQATTLAGARPGPDTDGPAVTRGHDAPASVPDPQAAPAGGAPPVDLPASTGLRFTWQQGSQTGVAELDWTLQGDRYELRLHAPGRWTMHSEGRIDDTGLLPLRHTERRARRSERAVSMVRPGDGAPGTLAFSARSQTLPLAPGMQDGISWLAQLVAWWGARPVGDASALPAMPVATTAGDARAWQFERDHEDAEVPGALKLVRQPTHAYDSRVELWLRAQAPHWPLRMRWSGPSGLPLQLDAVDDPAASSPSAAVPK